MWLTNDGRPTQRTEGAQVYLTRYSHDRSDAELEITYPSGRVVRHVRDGEGRVTAVRWRENASSPETQIIDVTMLWPFGPAWKMTLANGLQWDRPLDLDYRETGRTLGTVMNLALGYDAASNITSRTDAVTPSRSETFGYDALDRLTAATGVYGSLAYTYDANGNRASRTLGGVTDTYTYTYTYTYAYAAGYNLKSLLRRLLCVPSSSPSSRSTPETLSSLISDF